MCEGVLGVLLSGIPFQGPVSDVGFLSITFLIALPLALAPILLHLFDRRRNVTIEWGAMEFLLEAATRRTSARKLRQWLLLALRVLAIAALVLALARPKMPGHWFGSSEQSETVFVIDNSMSTMRESEDSTLFNRLIERAVTELNDIPRGDTIRILLASPYPVWATSGEIRIDSSTREMVSEQLRAIRPTTGGSDLLAAMFTAVQADSEQRTKSRRILMLTDGQASDWKTGDTGGWQRFQEVLQSASVPTRLEVIEPDSAATSSANIAVNWLRSSRLVAGSGQMFTLTAQIQNHSNVSSPECILSWQTESGEMHTEELSSLPGGDTHEATWRHSFAKPGVYSVSCELKAENERKPDNLAGDNRATVVIEIIEEIPVLVVEGSPGQSEMQQDAFFLQAAMGWVNGEAMETHSIYRPVTVTADELENLNIGGYRAVIIPSFTVLSEKAVEALRTFAFNGGGVWIALGPRTDIEMFNQYLFAHGDGLSPLAIDGIAAEKNTASAPKISTSLREHPATTALADSQKLDTNDIRVRRRFRFIPPPRNEDVSVLLSLTNGESIAVEKYVGQGRVIVMGIPLTMRDWSELAGSQAFVVMVQDWVAYLTQPQATRHNLLPGDPISVHLAESENREAFLKTPHGDQIEITADTVADGVVFRSSRTILPGDYNLQLGLSGESIPFHVQRNSKESNLTALSEEDHRLLADTAGLSGSMLNSNLSSTSHSDPVWPALLMLVILLMSIELILAGLISRERFGNTTIAETAESIGNSGLAVPFETGNKAVVERMTPVPARGTQGSRSLS